MPSEAEKILEAIVPEMARRFAAHVSDCADQIAAREADIAGRLAQGEADLTARITARETDIAERFDSLRADLLETVANAIATIPDPEPGADGRDGIDRVMMLPRYVKAGEPCEQNTIAQAAGGIWQAVRSCVGGPEDDPAGWRCLVPGIGDLEETADDLARRQYVFRFRMADGFLREVRGRMPAQLLPPDFQALGWGVLAGDTLRDEAGDMERMALCDGADPDRPEDWREYRLRGFRGQRGKPGEPGPPGPPGVGVVGFDVVEAEGALALVPRFTDPKQEAAPIVLDLSAADPAPDLMPIVGYAGRWDASRTYRRGVVVSVDGPGGKRLYLSTKSGNAGRPEHGSAWEELI